jgi:glyoxylase I family protein
MVTSDLERILCFYRDSLGFKEVARGGWRVGGAGAELFDRVVGLKSSSADAVMLTAGNLNLEFFQYSTPPSDASEPRRTANMPGWRHLSFDVVDIQDTYEQMLAAGATFDSPPQDLGFIKTVYGRDPDGNIIEIQELMGKDHPMQLDVLNK